MRMTGPKRIRLRVDRPRVAATLRADQARVVHDSPPDYEGETRVTPRTEPQTLKTENRALRADVTVEAIPFFKTTNPSGGYTAIIGG